MKKIVTLFIAFGLLAKINYSQTNPALVEFNKSRNLRTTRALKVLGAWSSANIAASGYGYYHSSESDKYFNQMNVIWNGVNAVIVAASLLPKQDNDLNFQKSVKSQSNVEAIYIANAGLDLVYASFGLFLTEKANTNLINRDKFNGWGNSLIMQGGFLFLLDTSMFIIHKKNGKKLYKMLDKFTISTSGIGMKIRLQL